MRPSEEEFLQDFEAKSKNPLSGFDELWSCLLIMQLLAQSRVIKIGDDAPSLTRKATLTRASMQKQLDMSKALFEKHKLVPKQVIELGCFRAPQLAFCLEKHKKII